MKLKLWKIKEKKNEQLQVGPVWNLLQQWFSREGRKFSMVTIHDGDAAAAAAAAAGDGVLCGYQQPLTRANHKPES